MGDELPLIPFNLPVQVSVSGSRSFEHKKITYDFKVYPPCTNKIEDVGRLKKRKFAVICDGQGHMKLEEMISPFDKLERLKKAYDNDLLTKEEYDKKRKEILDNEV